MHRDRLPRHVRDTCLEPRYRRGASRRAAALLLFMVGIAAGVLIGARSAPADEPAPVKNPHGSFKGECSQCHGESGWTPARISRKFDHSKFGFTLRGAHAAAPCRACHESLEFASAPTACASCHEDVHRGELGVDCARCHTSRSFIDRVGMVRAHRLTRFPLQGAHASVECEGCHPAEPSGHMRFTGTDVACVSCHLAEYQATTNPAHAEAGFSMECRTCHTMIAWQPARFDHSGTGFPLTGAHKTVPCTQCHVGGKWSGLDPACVSCHQQDYDATTDPSHTALSFPTTCADCHTTTTWSGAKFTQHDPLYFPIYSGRHLGTWTSCAQCHNDSGYYNTYTCLDCHPHDDKAGTDSHHVGIAGYQYVSTACYSCHPRGTVG